ncbi:hypothetical protein BLOT_014077 [Blomia tropicalis]|nr:hypothetical protein BLOT_014077 [Blomia tropicalis]
MNTTNPVVDEDVASPSTLPTILSTLIGLCNNDTQCTIPKSYCHLEHSICECIDGYLFDYIQSSCIEQTNDHNSLQNKEKIWKMAIIGSIIIGTVFFTIVGVLIFLCGKQRQIQNNGEKSMLNDATINVPERMIEIKSANSRQEQCDYRNSARFDVNRLLFDENF